MTAYVQPPYVCDEKEARALTDQIKGSVEKTWRLLLNAHEWKAWAALGYGAWRDYAQTEFGMSQAHAYRLLDAAKVAREIEAVAGSPLGELTEAAARDLKRDLPAVTDAVRDAVADVPEDERAAAAARAVKDARARLAPPRPQSSPVPSGPSRPATDVASSGSGSGAGEPVLVTTTTKTTEQAIVDRRTGEVLDPALVREAQASTALDRHDDGQTVPIEDHPDYQGEPSNADLDEQMARHLAATDPDGEFLRNLGRALVKCQDLLDLKPFRAVETYVPDSDDAVALLGTLDALDQWSREVRQGLRGSARGGLDPFRNGRVVRIRRSELDRYIQAHTGDALTRLRRSARTA